MNTQLDNNLRLAKRNRSAFVRAVSFLDLIVVAVAEKKRNAPEAGDPDQRENNTRQGRHIAADLLHKVKLKNTDTAPVQCTDDYQDQCQPVENTHADYSVLFVDSLSRYQSFRFGEIYAHKFRFNKTKTKREQFANTSRVEYSHNEQERCKMNRNDLEFAVQEIRTQYTVGTSFTITIPRQRNAPHNKTS